MSLAPRAVVVHRATELEELVARHGTVAQVEFFLRSRGRSLDEVAARHEAQQAALDTTAAAVPTDWRRVRLERQDLPQFVFGAEDVVVAVGQDGLVANVAKYLAGQLVVGLNPDPGRNPGVLVPHPPSALGGLLVAAISPEVAQRVEQRTMVLATVDDGQQLSGLNEVYVGHPSHQSARYRLHTAAGAVERQSSSGVLVGTGTGATGWCRSVALQRGSTLRQPSPTEPGLCWYTREAWPSPSTGTELTEGLVGAGEGLMITPESDLVVFADGIEQDALSLTWGQTVTLTVAPTRLHLLH